MKIYRLAAGLCFILILAMSAVTVSADGTELGVYSDSFVLSGQLNSKAQGMYTVEICDNASYSAENPIPSLIHRDQGITDSNGQWTYTVNMTGVPFGEYVVKTADSCGTVYETVALYTGKDEGVTDFTMSGHSFGSDENYTKRFKGPQTEGKTLISFKAKVSEGLSTFRFILLGTKEASLWTGYESFQELMRFDGAAVLGTGTEINRYTTSNIVDTAPDTEYTFDIWLDMDRRIITYYIDGEYWATIRLTDTFTEFWGWQIRSVNSNAETSAEVRDFRVMRYMYGEEQNFGESPIPQYIYESPDAYYTTGKAGNIFNDPAEVVFDGKLINREKKEKTYKYTVGVCDEEENTVYIDEQTLKLAAEETRLVDISIDMNRAEKQYGVFKLKTVLEDTEGETERVVTETDFSVIKSPAELNGKIGLNVHFGHYMGDPYINMNLLKNGGFSSARDFVDYASYTGEIGFSRYERWHGYAEEYGIDRVIILMGYDSATYGGVFPTTDAGRKNYTDYAVGVAEKLNGDAAVFELWNEMDWQVSASDYAKMLIDTVPAIKKVNSNAKIAVMCTARVNETEREWIKDVIHYIKYVKWLNPADYMDIISIHPYTRNIAPEESGCECGQENDEVGGLRERVAALRQILDNNGLSGVGIIATELGYYSTPDAVDSGRWNGGLHHDGLTERQQADYSVRTAALLYKNLDHMQFYCINKTRTGDLSEDGTGMTHTFTGTELPYKGKPVYAALAAFNSLLGNAEIAEENSSEGKYDYVFTGANGKKLHLMWTTAESGVISYTAQTDGVYIYDVYGNRSYMQCKDGRAEIPVSGSPVYVEDAGLALTDENNAEFSWTASAAKAKAYVSAETSVNFDKVWLLCGAFDDGKLISVSVKDIKEAGMAETEAIDVADADEIRVFLWENLKPIDDRYIKITR